MEHPGPLDPVADEARLAALHALALEEITPAEDFNALVALAADMLDCPMAALTLVDRDRQWLGAKTGDVPDILPRDIAFCEHTIRSTEAMIVPDLRDDARFAASPLVIEGGARFYAGLPIHATDPHGVAQPIGALCVIDKTPRALSEAGQRALVHLAALAEALIDARGTAVRAMAMAELAREQAIVLRRQDRVFQKAERMAAIGSWRLNLADQDVVWSDGVFSIYGLPVGPTPPLERALAHYPEEARAAMDVVMTRCIERGDPFDIEVDFLTADRRQRRVRAQGEREVVDGTAVALVGVFQDITERHQLESTLRRSAETDALTGLANRIAFERTLAAAIARAERTAAPLLLAMVDLDGFKAINDTLGHLAGDDVLKTVARTLREPWLAGSCVARLGGDEFALIVEDPALVADPHALVARLEAALQQPVTGASGITMASAGTVGTALLEPRMTSRDLVHAADLVLYAAKRRRIGAGLIPERRRRAA